MTKTELLGLLSPVIFMLVWGMVFCFTPLTMR